MPSILPGFEYDIFISYRHNDNRSGWVTEFVKNLQVELAATIKDPVSVYFDSNPHDGLQENHDVDESLREKLKSIILIPIISQTYCDTRSFAWKHEFMAFKQIAEHDRLGLKIKVANGNVARRLLPVCIHEIDPSDKQSIEKELGSALRGIEFIYRSQGISRPLRASEEDAKANLNHTYYHDQVAKVARAVKELMTVFQGGSQDYLATPIRNDIVRSGLLKKKLEWASLIIAILGLLSFAYYYFNGFGKQITNLSDRSIAVLPFENLSNDPEQKYFSNGMAEDILNHLNKISELRVKSRTSTLQYEDSKKTTITIGEELGVASILAGSVRRLGDKVRIVVQLIDAKTDTQLWSETYDRELKDVFAVQSEIAIEIAYALRTKLTHTEKASIEKEVPSDVIAYDFFLKARKLFNLNNERKDDYDEALALVSQALRIDPDFSRAYALKGNIWYNLSTFGIDETSWYDSAMYFASKAIDLDPTLADGYLLLGRVYRFMGNLQNANEAFKQAYIKAPNDPEALYEYGRKLLNEGKEEGADLVLKSSLSQYSTNDLEYFMEIAEAYKIAGRISLAETYLQKAKTMYHGSIHPYVALGLLYFETEQYDKAIQELLKAEKISTSAGVIDVLGWAYYSKNDIKTASTYWSRYKEFEATFADSTQIIPFRSRLAMAYRRIGRNKEADALFREALKLQTDLLEGRRGMGTWGNKGDVYYDLAVATSYFGKRANTVQLLDSAWRYQVGFVWGYHYDPMFDTLRDRPDFKKVLKKVIDYQKLRRKAYISAIDKLEASGELKHLLK